MPQPKISRIDLIARVNAAGIQQLIDLGNVTAIVQVSVPARNFGGRGRSEIVTFYSQAGSYLSTYHRLIRPDGTPDTHCHPKDAVIQGTKYYDP